MPTGMVNHKKLDKLSESRTIGKVTVVSTLRLDLWSFVYQTVVHSGGSFNGIQPSHAWPRPLQWRVHKIQSMGERFVGQATMYVR